MAVFGQSKIRFANLPDRKVLTVNMGKSKNGFNVCKKCGGAEVADATASSLFKFSQPYHDNHPSCRHLGLQLLNYAQYGQLPEHYDYDEQITYLVPLQKLISEDTGTPQPDHPVAFEVIPAILKKPDSTKSRIYLNPYDLSDWLPNAFMTYRNLLSEGYNG